MINVLIAEDELLIRMGLEASIPWDELGFHIVATASDGQKAYDAWEKYRPQVLITDIRMPKLDGLELIKRIRRKDSSCKIIIITCIEYFDTLYQSLDLNITGYLLKASMTHNTLYNLLNQVKRELSSTEKLSAAPENPALSIKDQFHKFLIDRSLSLDELLLTTPNLRISCNEQCYLLTVCCGYVNKTLFRTVLGTLKEEIASFGDLLVTFSDDRIYLFIQSQQLLTFEMISGVMDNFCTYMENIFSLSIRFVFAPAEKFNDLPTLADMSNHFIDQPYFFPDRGICLSNNQPYNIPFGIIESFRNNPPCYGFFENDVQERFFSLINTLKINYGTNKADYIAALSALVTFISDFCYSPAKKEELEHFIPSSFDTAPKALEELRSIIPNYSPNPLYISKILETIRYIHENYKESISISRLAAMLNVSSNYYTILFRKVTDYNFSDFLIGVRLFHARYMLSKTTLSMSQIADNCGFTDAAYFSKIFKQTYHITPRQYRALQQNLEWFGKDTLH